MKKLKTSMFSIIIALILCLILSACGYDSNSEDGASSESPVTTTIITTTSPETTTTVTTTAVEETTTSPVITEANVTQQNNKEAVVYVTDTGKKYHQKGCRFLNQSSHQISLSQAKQEYSPCSKCNPPT